MNKRQSSYKSTVKIKFININKLFLCLCILIIAASSINFQQLSVSAQSYIINTVTKYTVVYDRTQQNFGIGIDVNNYPVPAGSNVTLTIPSVYTLGASVGVSVSVNSGVVTFPNYTITSNTVNVFGLFPTQSIVYNVTLMLTNMLNPSPAITTDAFTGTIGSDYAQPQYLRSVVVLQPAEFQSCYMTFNPKYVNRTSAMIITIKTTTFIPSNGLLEITFPSNIWSQGAVTSTTNYLPITSSMSCTNLSSNVKSTLQCTGTQNQNKVTVSNLFASDIAAGSTISFQINNFLSPPTNKPADLIKLSSSDSLSNRINICSQYVSDLIPNDMLSSKITITNGGLPLTVNQQYTVRFMFETVDAFALTDYFEIQFPTGSIFSFNPNLLIGGITILKTSATFSGNVLRCYMNTLLSVKNYTSPFTMYISAGTYTAPPSTQTTGNFKISILRNSYPMQVGYQSLTAVATTLTGAFTSRGTDVVNKITTYTISVTINDPLTSSGKIRIRFPTQVSLASISTSTCAQLIGTSLADAPMCTVNPTTKIIELTNINSSTASIPAQTFTIVFTNITNPFSTAPTSSFQVRSFYRSTDSSLVAVGNVGGFTPKQATIDASNIAISSSSYKVLQQSVTYQVKYTVDNDIDMGGSFNLFVPKPILLNTAVLTSNCKRGINTITTTTTPCTLVSEDGTGYLIKFTSPLSSTSLPRGQYIILQLSNIITNAPSTSPVSTFKLYSYSSTNYLIAKIQSSLSIQMTDPTSLTTASYTRDSSKNYQLTSYQFTIKQHAQMETGAVVVIEFPIEILPNVTSLCGMTLPYVNSNLVCSLVNQTTIKIILPSTMPISSDTALTLTVSNVRNPTSYKPPGDFLIRTFTASQTYKYAQGLTSNKIANNIPSSFALITGSYSPGILDTDITLTLSFTPAYEAPGYLQLSIPSYFTVPSSLACSQVANFNGTCQTISTHTIQIKGQFTSNGMITFQISGFKSTIRAPTSTQFVFLTSFTNDNYQLDFSSNSITFDLACNLPCRTCDSVNKSMCLSCYSNILITDKVNYDSLTGSCYSQCPDGKYQDSQSFLCQNCDPICATCQGSATFCTTCNQSTANKYLNVISTTQQTCVSQCQQMMYADISRTPPTCVNCQSPCKTCTSLNFCLTCLDTYYFWQNTCTRTCPLGVTVGDNTTGKCELCNVNCLTCQVTVDKCTSCNSSLILYNNKCLTACVSPLVYRPQISTCGPCDPQCKTCSNIGSNCTSCDSVSLYVYLFNSNCLQSCPDLYYENVGSCALCSSLNINCDYCVNQTYCEKCNLGFVFFNGQCLATTPVGYVNISGFAQPCSGDCATCSITQTNCTSCKTLNLFGNICQATCPSGFIPLSNTCTSCQSPCLTCSENVNNCTSCNPNVTPKVYYLQNRCQTSCPAFYYADAGTAKCQPCQFPCLKCADLVTCSSCVDNYFLYQQKTCLTACPAQFVGINKICEACLSPCKTCVDSTTKCLTCNSGYFYLAATNQCLLDCGNGLYEEYLNQTCIACTQPCKTCTNTTNTCLSCLTGILYNNVCLTQCPAKMYNDTNTCQSCPSVCSSCISSTTCLSCTSPYILFNSYCITKCPETHAVILNNTCTKCSTTNCHKCYDNDLCFNCISDYSLLNGACLSACPAGFKTNGTHCNEVIVQSLQSSGNMFPVPLSIATAVVLVACMMSKLQNHRTFLSGAVYSLVGIIQTLALLYYIYLYYVNGFYPQYPIGMYVALASLGVLYILNLLSIIQSIVLCYDKKFCSWRDGSILNKIYNIFSTFISLALSHKFKNLMFSRLFAFVIFSAQLDDVRKFKIFNIYSFISLIHSGGCIFSVITIIKLVDNKTQFFHACLDLLIVVSLNVIVSFFNAFKGSDYFDQTTPQGYLLGKKMFADEDSYNAKMSVAGNDMQIEQGQGYYSKIHHALASNQAFKFKQNDESRQDLNSQYSDSLTNVIEKEYEDVSVQAYDILNEKQPSNNRINFSTLKMQNNIGDNSKFTTIFSNQDKSIQNTLDYDKVKKNTLNHEKGKKVDYSVQKYSDVIFVDQSMQGTIENDKFVDKSMQGTIEDDNHNDMSIQYSNNGARLQKDVSIQGTIDPIKRGNDISIQGTIDYVDRSGQYSHLQSQKSVQKMVMYNDRSIQQTIERNEWNGQNTIDMKEISIQKSDDNLDFQQNEQTFQQQNENDDTLLKNAGDNIFYIDEDMEDEIDEGLGSLPLKVDENKKTIARQQVPQQKEDDFDLPADEIISYQQQLQLKILQKQKQLQRVRKQIQLKERQSLLKQKLMREEKEKAEKNMRQREQQQKRQKELKELEQERMREQKQKERYQMERNNALRLEEAKKQAQRLKVQALLATKLAQQMRTAMEQQQANNNEIQQSYQKHQQKQQSQKPQQAIPITRLIQQMDQETSIDHSQMQTPHSNLQTPHFDIHQSIKIKPQQVQKMQEIKQQKLQIIEMVSQQQDLTSMDEEEVFLNGEIMMSNRRKNFQVDMNVYIKEKGETVKEGKDGDGQDVSDQQSRSVKTRAKSTMNRKRPNVYTIENTRQIQVKSTKQPSMPLNIQHIQHFQNIQQPVYSEELPLGVSQRQPGKIRVIDEPNYEDNMGENLIIQMDDDQEQQLEEQQLVREDYNDYNNEISNINIDSNPRNFLYEQENRQLNGNEEQEDLREEDEIVYRGSVHQNQNYNNNDSKIANMNNQSNVMTVREGRDTNSKPIGQFVNTSNNTNNNNPNRTILDETTKNIPLITNDHQLPQQQIIYHQHDQSLHEQQFDSSQDIPFQSFKHTKKNTQSDIEDYVRKEHDKVLSKQQQLNFINKQQSQLLDHQQLIKSFNTQSKRKLSNSKKPLPQQQPNQSLHVNINKLQAYHLGNKDQHNNNNSSRSINHTTQDKKLNSSSGSLLANAARNIIVSGENQKLVRKNSSKNNPLMTQKKWEYNQENRLNSIPQSSQAGNDSFVVNTNNNQRINSQSKSKQPPMPPTQTDKQQTSFSNLGQRVGTQANTNKIPTQHLHNKASSKSFNLQAGSQRRNSMKSVENQSEQVEVHFEKKQETTTHRNVQPQVIQKSRINERSTRLNRPNTTVMNNQNQSSHTSPIKKSISRQFESQQIFGDEYTPVSDAEYSEQQTEFNPSISKLHRNNLILDKMMDRPDNDDLFEYYNRASTQRGKSNKKRSNEKKPPNTKINLSKEKNQNDRKIQKIYMQRLDGSHAQIPRSKSRGRY